MAHIHTEAAGAPGWERPAGIIRPRTLPALLLACISSILRAGPPVEVARISRPEANGASGKSRSVKRCKPLQKPCSMQSI